MNRNIFIVAFINFINTLSISVIIPVIFIYARELGLTDFGASMMIALFALSQFIATPIIGRLSDYVGRKPLLVISLLGTALSNVMAAFAWTGWMLLLARVFDGITGGNVSVAQAVISDTVEPEKRGNAFALFGMSFGFAFVVGPLISLFAQQISLNAPFLVAAAMAFIATTLTAFVLPETLTIKEEQKLSFRNLGFTQVATSLQRPVVGQLLMVTFLTSVAFTIFTFAFQPFVIERYLFDEQMISVTLFVFGLVNIVTLGGILRVLLKRFSMVSILIATLVGNVITLFIYPALYSVPLFFLNTVVFGVFAAMPRSIVTSLISIKSKQEDQGVAIGVNESYYSLASAIGPALGGFMLTYGVNAPLLLAATLSIVGVVFTYVIRKRLDEKAEPLQDL